VSAGASHVPYKKYFVTCATISVIQSFVMLMLGILFGHAYTVIGKYLNYYAAFVSVVALVVLVIVFLRKYKFNIRTLPPSDIK